MAKKTPKKRADKLEKRIEKLQTKLSKLQKKADAPAKGKK
jgi:hypothetical protein